MNSFVSESYHLGEQILATRSVTDRKKNGQFLTPPAVACFMARQLEPIQNGQVVLDPAVGSGTLLCAVIDYLIDVGTSIEVWLEGFDLDASLLSAAEQSLDAAVKAAARAGITVHVTLHRQDFLLTTMAQLRPSLLNTEKPPGRGRYDHIIANPPYFKLSKTDERRTAAEGFLEGHTNIYTLFMSAAARLLETGNACFLVPRSFCSGVYFKRFRRDLLEWVAPYYVHLFTERDELFDVNGVLQENLIFAFSAVSKKEDKKQLNISTSSNIGLKQTKSTMRSISQKQFVSMDGRFRLPTSEAEEQILQTVDSWPGRLPQYGLEISTGPIVAFRADEKLTDTTAVYNGQAVPMLWMQHVTSQQLKWPINDRFRKPQGIAIDAKNEDRLLLPNKNYVLLRRFSAKEEKRRLTAAPYLSDRFQYPFIGLENHLNYIHRPDGCLTKQNVVGLAALLNNLLLDRYFRISNGNTQVNATELRVLPLPPFGIISKIGQIVCEKPKHPCLDDLVLEILVDAHLVPRRLADKLSAERENA